MATAALCMLGITGCSDDGTRTISSSVIGSLACYASPETWYNYLTAKSQGLPTNDGTDAAVMLLPGDRVQLIEIEDVDKRPGLVSVTGFVAKVKALSGISPGTICWLYSGSNTNGPLFD